MFAIMAPAPSPNPLRFVHSRDFAPLPEQLYKPAVSSPLSSPPVRTTSPPALFSRDPNVAPRRETQSSPIPARTQSPSSWPRAPPFKYAARDARPNPLVRRRDDAQDGRRRLFLQNVRQRADDRRWEQRGGENELLKLEWFRETREMREAKRTDTDGVISAEDVELEEDSGRRNHHPDQDEAMLGMIEEQEQAEVDALLSSYSPSDYSSQIRPDSPHFSDEDDYDSLFRDFLVQQKSQGSPFSEDVEMSL